MTGKELQLLRKWLTLEVSDLATLFNVSERLVRYWEAGQRPISPETIEKLVVVLKERQRMTKTNKIDVIQKDQIYLKVYQSVEAERLASKLIKGR